MKCLHVLALLAVLSCSSSSDAPLYAVKVEPAAGDTFTVRLDGASGASDAELRRALFREAARTVIDRGGTHFRADHVTVGAPTVVVEQSDASYPAPAAPTNTTRGPSSSQTSFSRERGGEIRVTIVRNGAASGVYEASRVLDQVRRGETP
jgi:hypothetical protein